jgi:DNA-binding NarL/FixJ family response regulator
MSANSVTALRPAPSLSLLGGSSERERLPTAILGTRVVVAAGEPIYRAGIAHVLERSGAEIAAGADTPCDLIRRLRAHRPDVAVVDMDLWPDVSETDRTEALREIRAIDPHLSLLILSELPKLQYVLVADDRPDGFGYLLKASLNDVDELTASVRRVAQGGVAIDPLILARLAGRRRRRDPFDSLTDREKQVLDLIAEGRSNRSIAARLHVEVTTVERHITSIFGKLDLHSDGAGHRRVLAVLRYLDRPDP